MTTVVGITSDKRLDEKPKKVTILFSDGTVLRLKKAKHA